MLAKFWIAIKLVLGVLVGTLLGLGLFFLIGGFIFDSFYKPFIVLSGSMEPSIPTGSVVFVKPATSYQVGDVITFSGNSKDDLVTHRIAAINESGIITKGDANEETDTTPINQSQIIGALSFNVPYLGYLVDFGKTPQGFILLVIIPATIIVYEEMRSIKLELDKQISRLRKHKGTQKINMNEENLTHTPTNKRGIPKAYALIPVLGCAFLIVAATAAYFSDSEKSQENSFSAASSFTQEVPTTSTLGVMTEEAQPTTNLEFSEVYYDTTPNSQWVKIYNPNSSEIDISNWSIRDSNNCDGILGGTVLPANGSAVISPLTLDQYSINWPSPEVFVSLPTAIGNGIETGETLTLSSSGCEAELQIVAEYSVQ